jgi:hypothetical protein
MSGEMTHMWTLSIPVIFWATIAIQLMSLAAVVAIRLCPSGPRRSLCQQLFFASLLGLGLITVLAVAADSDSWVTSGATLSVMTVCATFDFRGQYAQSPSF